MLLDILPKTPLTLVAPDCCGDLTFVNEQARKHIRFAIR